MKLTDRSAPFTLPGYPDFLAGLLHARGVHTAREAERFLRPNASELSDPMLLHGMGDAVAAIRRAKDMRTRVAVYGDYDADGVCASAILLFALRHIGIDAFSYIPDRAGEGYGLHSDAIRRLAQETEIVVTVDCGVTALEEAALARQLGLRLVITDHHTLPDTLPDAEAIVHPALGGVQEPLCGAGVAWKLAWALAGWEWALQALELAALATVADLVPLLGENRAIAALGLAMMAETKRPGLRALKAVAGIKDGVPVTGEQAGYQLAPRLNAGGRLASARLALDLLMSPDDAVAQPLAAQLDTLNRERRDVEALVLKEADAQVAAMDLPGLRTLVVSGDGWNSGVVGLVAGRLAQRWNYPSIALTRAGDMLHGSGRSAGEVDLHAALQACADLFDHFGGHRMAAGLTMPATNLEAFRARFDGAVRSQLGEGDLFPETVHDGEIAMAEVSLQSADLLRQLEPCGMGNPAPRFLLKGARLVSARAVGSGGAHLKVAVEKDGIMRDGIAFGMGEFRAGGGRMDIVAGIARNEYNGYAAPQLIVRAILPVGANDTPDALAQARCALRELTCQNSEEDTSRPITALPAPGHRGTLYACRTARTADLVRQTLPGLDVFEGSANDARAFSAVCYLPDWDASHAHFGTVVLADGALHPGEAARAGRATGAIRVLSMPTSAPLVSLLGECALSVDELRAAWVRLRKGDRSDGPLPPIKSLAARMALQDLGLLRLDAMGQPLELMNASRVDPDSSKLFSILRTL